MAHKARTLFLYFSFIEKHGKYFYFCSILMMVIITYGLIEVSKKRMHILKPLLKNHTLLYVEIIADWFAFFASITGSFCLSLCCKCFKEISAWKTCCRSNAPMKSTFYFSIYEVQITLVIIMEMIVTYQNTKNIWLLSFLLVQYFLFQLLLVIMKIFVNITTYYQDINKTLIENNIFYLNDPFQSLKVIDAKAEVEKTQFILRRFTSLCDILDKANSKIKWFFSILVLSLLLLILKQWCISAEIMINTPILNEGAIVAGIAHLCFMLCLFISAGAIGLIGERLESEATNTAQICYNIIVKISSKNICDQSLKETLNILINQCQSRKIFLSTVGYYRINLDILGLIGSAVATYYLIVTQFALKN